MAGLFDKVVVGINRGWDTVSEGSKIIVEKARINTQIQDLEKGKNAMLVNMGNLIYNLQQSGEVEIEQCKAMCEEITNYNKKIADFQEQLKMLDGQRIQSTPIAQGVETVICGQCGAVNRVASKYCSGCGKPLN